MAASVVMDALVASLEQCVADFQLKISNGGYVDSSAAIVDSLNKELAASLVRRDEIMEYFERKVYNLEEFLERCEKLTLGLLLLKSIWRLFPLLLLLLIMRSASFVLGRSSKASRMLRVPDRCSLD